MAIGTGAAILGGAVIAGGLGLAASSAQAGAAKSAAAAQERAAAESVALQREIFNTTRSDTAPFRQGGLNALSRLQVGTGLMTPEQIVAARTEAVNNSTQASAPASAPTGPGSPVGTPGQPGQPANPFAFPLAPGAFSHPDARRFPFGAIEFGEGDIRPAGPPPGFDPAGPTNALAEASSPANALASGSANALTPGALGSVTAENLGTFGDLTGPIDISQEELEATPGFQFARDQALSAATRGAQARGLSLSGNALMDLGDRAGGMASQRFDTERGFRFGERTQRLNTLLSMAGFGQVANQTGANAGSNFANASQNALQKGAFNAGAANIGASNAQAAGLTSFGKIANNALNNNAVQNLFANNNSSIGSGGNLPINVQGGTDAFGNFGVF